MTAAHEPRRGHPARRQLRRRRRPGGANVGLVLVPVVSAYQRGWERVVAGLVRCRCVGAFVGIGILAGAGVIYLWPRYSEMCSTGTVILC